MFENKSAFGSDFKKCFFNAFNILKKKILSSIRQGRNTS